MPVIKVIRLYEYEVVIEGYDYSSDHKDMRKPGSTRRTKHRMYSTCDDLNTKDDEVCQYCSDWTGLDLNRHHHVMSVRVVGSALFRYDKEEMIKIMEAL